MILKWIFDLLQVLLSSRVFSSSYGLGKCLLKRYPSICGSRLIKAGANIWNDSIDKNKAKSFKVSKFNAQNCSSKLCCLYACKYQCKISGIERGENNRGKVFGSWNHGTDVCYSDDCFNKMIDLSAKHVLVKNKFLENVSNSIIWFMHTFRSNSFRAHVALIS